MLDPLPIDPVLPELVAALRERSAAVLVAPTGAGKTTRVPPALLAAGLGPGQIVVLEPRRIAARAAARRIAEEQGWEVGREVGYQVRFERKESRETRILIVTEGILVQRLQGDPFLESVDAVVFDEIHERNLQTDLSLAMARRVRREVRPDLRLLAMSATLDPGPLAAFLGDCPVVESAGRLYPVAVAYLDPAGGERRAARGGQSSQGERQLPLQVLAAVRRALAESDGDVLVFLPGVGEIERCAKALAELAAERGLAVLPLYGDLPPERQDAVLKPSVRRRVVLATNVAETSVTVQGVTAVVDSGLARRLRYDPATGLDRLELVRVSRAATEQRAGRAGRQAPGLCLRLWAEHEQAARPEREPPEIARVDLAGPALQLLAWGESDLAAFGWFEAPDPAALAAARRLLDRLGATDPASGVTALGRTLARLPLHPRLGRLLVEGAQLGHPREAALAAALLTERDPFARDARVPPPSSSDVLDRVEALAAWESRGGRDDDGRVQAAAARFVLRARDQLADLARRELASTVTATAPADDALLRALLAAFPDRLARRREGGGTRAVMVGGRGVQLGEESAVRDADLFLCIDLADPPAGRTAPAEARVRRTSFVKREWLPADRLRTAVEVGFDTARERVVAWKRTRFDDLVIDEGEVAIPPSTAAEAERALVAAAAERLDRALPLADSAVVSFRNRVACLAAWMPELALPSVDDDALRALLPALAAGRASFAELRRAPLLEVLTGTLSFAQREALDREAPER
ncbi:MAG TPA: ATP-dependent helicase HrpB, partial [Thermoanaerobaculia bacterium]